MKLKGVIMRKRLVEIIIATATNFLILGAGIYIFYFLSIGPDACAIESCTNYSSYKYYQIAAMLIAIATLAGLIIFNLLATRKHLQEIRTTKTADKYSARREILLFSMPVLGLFALPFAVWATMFGVEQLKQQKVFSEQISHMQMPAGCDRVSRERSISASAIKYNCVLNVTNAQLYKFITADLKSLGYSKYYDDTRGSSYYNIYQFGFSSGHLQAVYIFDNQSKFSPEEASKVANQQAGGYTLKLYYQ
jgi:hypothetical protein